MRQWTLLVYMAADNDLDQEAVADIQEMLSVGTSPEVRVAVLVDRAGRRPTTRYVIPERPGCSLRDCPQEQLPEIDTGDPRHLVSFLAWGRKTFPSERLGLILWNHGYGWRPYDLDAVRRTHAPKGKIPREPLLIRGQPLAPAAYIGFDEGQATVGTLDMPELGKALAKGLGRNRRLDLIGFDACLMSQLEVAYQVKNHTHVLLGAEESMPGFGLPYNRVLPILVENPTLAAAKIARRIADRFLASIPPDEARAGWDQAVLLTRDIKKLARMTHRFGMELTMSFRKDPRTVRRIAKTVQRYAVPDYADLGDIAFQVTQVIDTPSVQVAAKDVLDALRLVVGFTGNIGEKIDRSRGISIYWPIERDEFVAARSAYSQLDFNIGHPGWMKFLATYHAPPA